MKFTKTFHVELTNHAPSKREFFLLTLHHSCNDLENVFLTQQIKYFYTHLAQNEIPILRLNRKLYLIK